MSKKPGDKPGVLPGTRKAYIAMLARRERVFDMVMRCMLQKDIARELGVNQSVISRDIQAVEKDLRERPLPNAEARRQRLLGELDVLKREAWSEWERSKRPSESVTRELGPTPPPPLPETLASGQPPAPPPVLKSSVTVEGKCGDPRYLEQVRKAIAEEADLLGLHVTTEDGKDKGSSLDLAQLLSHAPVEVTAGLKWLTIRLLRNEQDPALPPGVH